MTDDQVFKVKKPVDFGFLDFSSLEKRRAACEAEVRLNERLAPQTYRGVVPVYRERDGRHRFCGTGEIVDWAVHMRRLADVARADHLLAHEELGGADIDVIAVQLADFHARAEVRDQREALAANVEENFRQMRGEMGRYLGSDEGDEIERRQRGFVAQHRDLFAQRLAAKRVRDGHGDLRLEHVYLESAGHVTILDCIEFNARFRYADVCSDVAFLSMDLAWHGSVDLGERLLATYARETNDFELYALVDFYEGYRAFVRGKICHFVASDANAPFSTRERAAREARQYFLLALGTEKPAVHAPCLIAVGGLMASGKSTLSTSAGRELGAPVIEADRIRKHLLGVAATEPLHDAAWKGAYEPAFSQEVYREVFRLASVVLASGRSVVLDASFRSAAMRRSAHELALAQGVPFRFIECRVPVDVRRARLAQRENTTSVSDGRLEIDDAFVLAFEPVIELLADEHLVVDDAHPAGEILASIFADRRTEAGAIR